MSLTSKSLSLPLILGGVSISLGVGWNHYYGRSSSSSTLTQAEKDDKRLLGGSSAAGKAKKAAKEWFSDHAAKLFKEADLNQDGTLSLTEVYELVLKFYIVVNRKAPIPPPTRQRVLTLLRKADKDNSGNLDQKEFERLLSTLYARASSRVLTHKLMSNVCAPFLAIGVADFIKGQVGLLDTIWSVVPPQTPQVVVNALSEEKTWIALLAAVFSKQLLSAAMEAVDRMWWGENAEDQFYETVSELKENVTNE